MTNKEQVIIDGVDVKDCRRRIGKNSYCRYFKRLCSDNNVNCVWKQLARKTQECENYKKRAVCFKDVNKQLGYKYLTIKQECEELKRKVELMMDCPDCKVDEYKKALEEIEEIVNKKTETSICSECAYNHISECKDICMQDVLENILDIINKAKGGEDEHN